MRYAYTKVIEFLNLKIDKLSKIVKKFNLFENFERFHLCCENLTLAESFKSKNIFSPLECIKWPARE